MRFLKCTILCCGIISCFYFLLAFAYKLGAKDNIHLRKLINKKTLLYITLINIAALILFIIILNENQWVYFWDSGKYWSMSYQQSRLLFSRPREALQELYTSINENDYNYLLPMLIALPLKLFGEQFNNYAVINFIMFLVPSWFVVSSCILKLYKKKNKNITIENERNIFLLSYALVVFFPRVYIPIFKGYIDVGCVLITSVLFFLAIDYTPEKADRNHFLKSFMIGLLLIGTFLFRRYFAYFIVGFVLVLFISSVVRSWSAGKDRKELLNIIINFAIIGVTALCILLLFFRPMVERILSSDYGQMYAAYDAEALDKYGSIVQKTGIFILIAVLISSYIDMKENGLYRNDFIYMDLLIIIVVLLFSRVQKMGSHHYYLIEIPIMIMSIYYYVYLLMHQKKKLLSGMIVLYALNYLSVYSFVGNPLMFFTQKHFPFYRDDIQELHRIENYVNSLTEGTKDKVYILGSSQVFSGGLMAALERPESEKAIKNTSAISDVDLRDGIRTGFFAARYVVVADPVQVYLAEGTQEVVRYLGTQLLSPEDNCISVHYIRHDIEFDIEEDTKVYVYERISDYTKEDLNEVAEYFDNYYPGSQELFRDRIEEFIERMNIQ